LVTLVNRSGHSSAKSRSTVWHSRRECSAATPLTWWPRRWPGWPADLLVAVLAISDIRRIRASSPRELGANLVEEPPVVS